MRKHYLFTLVACLLALSAWAADVSYTETFSKIGNLNNGTSEVYGDLCSWHRTLASHRAQDTILIKTRRAFLLPVAYAGKGKLETTDWEGGIKKVEFKFGRFGSEKTEGRVLQLNVKAGTIQNPTPTFAKNAMKLSTGDTPQGNENYSFAFNCMEQDAQLVIENISTHNETLGETSSICRILVADIVVTPYILYTQKEATIGLKQQGYVNQEFLDNSGGEALTYSSSNTSIATVDPATGVVTPVSAGDVQIYAALAEGARTHYTLHIVDGIVAENFSKVVQTGSASNATWHGDLFDWTANAARRGANDTIKGRPIDRQQATWFSKEGYVESSAVVEGGVKNISFLWRQWSAKAESTTTKVAVSYGGEVKAYQEFEELAANDNKSFNEDIDGGNANAVMRISNLSYNGTGTVNNRIVIENVKITPYLLYTTKEATLDTRNSLTFTNSGLINNTTGDAPTYEIAPANAAVSISAEGLVAVEEGADVNGDFTVTATWGAVTTSYTLHILSRNTANVSFTVMNVRAGLGEVVSKNELKKNGHDGTPIYSSNNDAVATVDPATGAVTLQGKVGQVKISASLPQTENYKAASASYNLYVRDNNARKEAFGGVKIGDGVVGTTAKDWEGDLFPWTAQYSIRKNANDTIWGATKGVWIATGSDAGGAGVLNSTDVIEGGIKYLSFYWKQWANESGKTLRIAAFDDATRKGYMEYVPNGTSTHEKFLLGINDMMRGNRKLYIKNESYTGTSFDPENITTSNSRIIIDTIYITPYLLYTIKERTLDMKNGINCTYTPEINNIESGSITYSLEDNDGEASIEEATGKVTGLKAGEVTVKATWSEGAYTTYTLTILAKSIAEPSFDTLVVCMGLDEEVKANELNKDGHDGTATYASSNTAVADFEAGELVIKGVGQTTITATLPETENYFAAEASYNLYVRDNNARKEAFKGLNQSGVVGVDLMDLVDATEFLFDWQAQYQVRRGTNDTIWDTTTKGVSIGIQTSISAPSILQSKDPVEGGIKHLSFYWKQWANNADKTLRMSAYAGSTLMAADEHPSTATPTFEKYLFGASAKMKSNQQLIIKNESYTGSDFEHGTLATDAARIIIDTIYITPYLLYTTKADTITIGESYTNNDILNNTGGNDITYSLEDNEEEASISGATVTGLKPGEVTVKATWSEGAYTWYTLTILDKADAELAFTKSVVKVRSNDPAVSNPVSSIKTTAAVTYSSDNTDVAEVDENSGFVTIKGEGIATITAHSDANDAYKAGDASYTLHVMPTNWYMETFSELSKMCIVAPEATSCATEPVTDGLDNNIEWTYWLGGGNTAIFGENAMYLRARKSGETCDYGYIKSDAITGGLSSLSFQWNQGGNESAISNYNIIVKVNGEEVGSITAEGKNAKYDTPQEFSVTGLQYSGDVVIEIINETAYDGTDNRGRFVIDNLEWIGYTAPIITLNEASDNSEFLSENAGKKVDVTIIRSALKGGVWNTLCLPFAISKADDLGDAEVQKMTSAEYINDVLTVGFSALTDDELEAGKPYMVKPASDLNISGTYINKTITSIASPVSYSIITMQGTFSPVAVTANDYSTLFVGTPNAAGDNLFYPSSDGQLRGLRAHFKIAGESGNAPKRARFVVDQEEVATGVENVQSDNVQSTKVLRDGQLYIMYNGTMYNVQGARVQ